MRFGLTRKRRRKRLKHKRKMFRVNLKIKGIYQFWT